MLLPLTLPSSAERVSACHHALRCTEILDQVLQEFYSWTSSEMYRSSCHVALVCHAFFHSAAAVIWHDIPSLQPLYSLLVVGAIHPKPNIVSFDPPQAAWTRFLRYASLIHIVRRVELQELDSDRFRALVRCNGGRTILPSARAFTICGRTSGVGPARALSSGLALIASPVVSTLNLGYIENIFFDLFLSSAVAKAFPALERVTLPLQALMQSRKRIPGFIAGLVGLSRLRSLELTTLVILKNLPLETTLVDRLISTLPRLEYLDVGNPVVHSVPPRLYRWQGATACPVAPRLRHFVCFGTWDAVAGLPSALTCPCLEELRFSIRQRFSPDNAQDVTTVLSRCMRDIAESRFAPRLRKLSVNARYNVSGGIQQPVLPPMADLLGPLFALERLEALCFKLHGRPFPRLPAAYSADDDMHAMAAGLPRIHHLELRHDRHTQLELRHDRHTSRGRPLSINATLRSLAHFAVLCPHLVSLSLAVCMDDVAGHTWCIPPIPWQPGDSTMRRLELAPSTAVIPGFLSPSDLKLLAAFLHHLFPRLDISECSFRSADEDAAVRDELRVLGSSQRT